MEINQRALFFMICLIAIVGLFIGGLVYDKMKTDEYNKQVLEKIKADNDLKEKLKSAILVGDPKPTPNPTPYIIQSPAPIKINNRMMLGQYFNWKGNNVSGLKDINVSITVYGYKELQNFSYYDFNWGQDFKEYSPDGTEFFFAYVHIEQEETGVTVYLPQQSNFALQIADTLYYPVMFPYEQNQIREMDNNKVMDNTTRIIPYAYEYIKVQDNVTHVERPDLSPLIYLRPGKSNAQDGYIIFNIPIDYNKRMAYINGDFWSFGSASWNVYKP